MKVQYERLSPGMYGATDHTSKTITLATEDWDVFLHELGHAIHRTFEPKSGHGQDPEAETLFTRRTTWDSHDKLSMNGIPWSVYGWNQFLAWAGAGSG